MRNYVVFSIALTGVVVIALEISAGWLVPFFFGSEFDDAVLIMRILLVGAFLWGVRRVLTDTTSGSGRPGFGSIAELASWVAIVPALALLMPVWGVEGVAAAMVVSSALSLLVLVLLVRFDRRGLPILSPGGRLAWLTGPAE
jgi:O-antigen/teichoic acid export membrane protein